MLRMWPVLARTVMLGQAGLLLSVSYFCLIVCVSQWVMDSPTTISVTHDACS